MFCPNCGSQIADNSQFCPQCGSRVANQPDPVVLQAQPVTGKKSKKVWLVLCAVVLVAAAAALTFLFLLRGKNDYQRIIQAVGNTIRMDSAEITVHDDHYDDYDTVSFCIDSGNSELRYYYWTPDGDVQGYYDEYFFDCWDDGGDDISGYKRKDSQRSSNLTAAALFHFCSGRDVKSFVRAFVSPLLDTSSNSAERSRESTDMANLRSAYAELMMDALIGEEIETEQEKGSVTILPTTRDADGNLEYTATVAMSQTKPGWQKSDDASIGMVDLSNKQPGKTATLTLRYPYETVEFSFSGELTSESPEADNVIDISTAPICVSEIF